MLTPKYLNWIMPLLEHPEDEILLKHTSTNIRIKNWEKVRSTYNLTHRQLRGIVWKLKFLTQLYELETIVFDI